VRFYIFFTLSLSLFLSACYNKEFNEPGKISINRQATERIYEIDFSRVWAATQQVLSRFPVEQKNQEDATGRAFVVTNWIEGSSDILYSGYAENRVPYRIRYKLYIYVLGDRATGRTQVRIENVEQYRDDAVTAGVDFEGSLLTWIRTDSSTLKEARILDEIQKLVVDRSFQPDS
jgi:hypothetical protein